MMNSSKIIENRSELLFLYDIKDGNPNGDPLDENKPRLDEETGVNLVTDVRLKRTIRDYLMNYREQEIFIKENVAADGTIQTSKTRADDFLKSPKSELKDLAEMKKEIDASVLKECIDIRLFGVTMPIELDKKRRGSIIHTGPVQFNLGRSLHKVVMKHIKGTGAFASQEGATQKTFREEDILYYSLICFYGIINENVAKETNLTEGDVQLLLDGIWNGTKNLITRSKFGQVPRVLVRVIYGDKNYHLGELNAYITLKTDLPDEKVRGTDDYQLDLNPLYQLLKKNHTKIASIQFKIDKKLKLVPIPIAGKEETDLNQVFKDITENASELKIE